MNARLRTGESPRGITPRGSRRTVREPLDSYSSHHGAMPRPHLPVGEQLRSTTRDARDPVCRSTKMATQLLVFPLGPKDQISVQFAHGRVKDRPPPSLHCHYGSFTTTTEWSVPDQ